MLIALTSYSRIVGRDQNDVNPGEPGEAWLRGPIITSGYHTDNRRSREAFQDGWYRTGDIVKADGSFIYVLGRAQVSSNVDRSHCSHELTDGVEGYDPIQLLPDISARA